MAKPIYDAMVKNGTYKDRDGNEKSRWLKVGAVFEGEKGLSMILECVPVGATGPVWVSFFEVKERQSASNSASDGEGVPF